MITASRQFKDYTAQDQEYIFENKENIQRIANLQKNVIGQMDRNFHHFLDITHRNVSGNSAIPYFRGSGASYSVIRYQLDYQNYFIGNATDITFKVWLHVPTIQKTGLNSMVSNFNRALAQAGATYPGIHTGDWTLIYTTSDQPSNAQIHEIIHYHLSKDWLDLEKLLSDYFEKHQTQTFYQDITNFLQADNYAVIEEDNSLRASHDFTEFNFQFVISFVPPDYTEIILYGNASRWYQYRETLKNISLTQKFILFDHHQSFNMPEIRIERERDTTLNYDALLKRSFREEDKEKALAKFIEEFQLFLSLTKQLDNE